MFRKGFVAIMLVVVLAACTKVEPGYVGIRVNNYGNQRGVEDFPLQTGRVWFNMFTEEVYKFPTFVQNHMWTRDDRPESPTDESFTVNSVEGATVNFDVSFSLSFIADSVPRIFVDFRKDENHIIDEYVRRILQNSFSVTASRMKVTDIFGAGKQALQDSVLSHATPILETKGMEITQLAMVGEMRVDPKVQESINAVLTAAQRAIEAENKVKQAEAEAFQMIESARGDSASAVIRATGQARANDLLQRSLTPSLIEYQKALKWNGVLPTFTGNATPFLNINPK